MKYMGTHYLFILSKLIFVVYVYRYFRLGFFLILSCTFIFFQLISYLYFFLLLLLLILLVINNFLNFHILPFNVVVILSL